MDEIILKIKSNLSKFGFRNARTDSVPNCVLLLKFQKLNINRSVVVIKIDEMPTDIAAYLKTVRNAVAREVKFFPFFWGLGIQIVLICPGIASKIKDPSEYVATADNQWAIIQSVYFFDPVMKSLKSARSWGQFLSTKFQDAILEAFDIKNREDRSFEFPLDDYERLFLEPTVM